MRPHWIIAASVFALFAGACQDATNPGGTARHNLDGEQSCAEVVTPIFAGQHEQAGTVTVQNDDDSLRLYLSSATAEGWYFRRLHIDAGTGDATIDEAGAPAPGQFAYSFDFAQPTATHGFAIPFDELDAGCGDVLTLAVHADMARLDAAGTIVQRETGWAFGDPFEGTDRWGWTFDYPLCCGPDSESPGTPDAGAPAPDPGHRDCG